MDKGVCPSVSPLVRSALMTQRQHLVLTACQCRHSTPPLSLLSRWISGIPGRTCNRRAVVSSITPWLCEGRNIPPFEGRGSWQSGVQTVADFPWYRVTGLTDRLAGFLHSLTFQLSSGESFPFCPRELNRLISPLVRRPLIRQRQLFFPHPLSASFQFIMLKGP